MTYSEKLVVAVKVNGQILRDSGDTVSLPFGCEYSILVKNLNSVRSQISVSVDGTDATDGTRLIIPPNSSVELERFIKNGNLQSGNRFKFIERSGAVEKHRGIGSDDGLIRVESWKERVQQFVDVPIPRYYDQPIPRPRPWYGNPHYGGLYNNTVGGVHTNSVNTSSAMNQPRAKSASPLRSSGFRSFDSMPEVERSSMSFNDAGITVGGSQSNQQFFTSSGFPVEVQSVVIVMRLRGDVGGKVVVAPITVKAKPTCTVCGKTNKSDMQFCGRCGAALEIL